MTAFSDGLAMWALLSVLVLNSVSAFASGRVDTGWMWLLIGACALTSILMAPALPSGPAWPKDLIPVRLGLFALCLVPALIHYLSPRPQYSGVRLGLLPLAAFVGLP